jgi:RNA pseudouridylate synthase
VLSKAIAERKIEKTYLALCRKKIALGTVQHCFRRKSKSHENAKPTLLRAYDASLLEQKSSVEDQQAQPNTKDLNPKSLSTGKRGGKKFGVKKRLEPSTIVNKENGNADSTNSKKSRESKGSSRSGNQPGSVWQLAELEVLSCTALTVRDLSKDAREHLLDHPRASSSGSTGDGGASGLYECEIRLITGRTHQIRLQLAALGASIIGDTRYNPVEGLLDCSHDAEEAVVSTVIASWRGVREDSQLTKVGSADSHPPNVPLRAVGDGEHLMGPEPKR